MNIYIYNLIQILTYPILVLYFFLRVILKKETIESVSQKLFINDSSNNVYDYIVHVSSVGELNSINFLFQRLFLNKKVLITCSTLTAYKLAKKRYINNHVKFLPVDLFILVKIFIKKNKTKKFIWIDSEIWPNYLYLLRIKKVKNYLINARISQKSFDRWSYLSNFICKIGSNYERIFASSKEDQHKFAKLLNRDIEFHGNLKFFQKSNITKKSKKIICFGSIHYQEFKEIVRIISKLDFKNLDEIIIIPRHPIYVELLKEEVKRSGLINSKISIVDQMGLNIDNYKKSKITFMGGSLFNHGGQNPLEPVSCGSFVITGAFIHNFDSIYQELLEENLCYIFKGSDNDLLTSYIETMMKIKNPINNDKLEEIFSKKISNLENIINKINND